MVQPGTRYSNSNVELLPLGQQPYTYLRTFVLAMCSLSSDVYSVDFVDCKINKPMTLVSIRFSLTKVTY